jgi:hypothetical protein
MLLVLGASWPPIQCFEHGKIVGVIPGIPNTLDGKGSDWQEPPLPPDKLPGTSYQLPVPWVGGMVIHLSGPIAELVKNLKELHPTNGMACRGLLTTRSRPS